MDRAIKLVPVTDTDLHLHYVNFSTCTPTLVLMQELEAEESCERGQKHHLASTK
jgi:hypothetical protein